MLSVAQLDQALRRSEVAPVYLLVGPEAYLHHTAIEQIAKTLRRITTDTCEPVRLAAEDVTAEAVVERAESLGLFSTRQLLVMRGIEAWRAEALEVVANYVASPNPATTLILCAEKLDGRTKAAKAITDHAVAVVCKPLYASQIPDWIRMECDRLGKPIAREAAQFLAGAIGTDLGLLANTIEKLMLYAGEARLIEPKLVEHLIVETSSHDIFAFTRAVGEKDLRTAVARLVHLLDANEPAVRLLTMLARHWRLLYRTRSWCEQHKGRDERELAATLKIHPFFVKEYVGQSAHHSLATLRTGFGHLAQADRHLKRAASSDQAIMTHCLAHLCMVQ